MHVRVRVIEKMREYSVPSGCEDGILGPEPMERPILETESNDPTTLSIFHEEVEGKVLNKVLAVVLEGLSVERVEEGVTGPIRNATAPMSLTSLPVREGLTAKGSLVNLTICRPAKRHP
jgi:hypothetical protein